MFFSNPKDQEILKRCKQRKIFAQSLIGKLTDKLFHLQFPLATTIGLPDHVDMLLSAFETKETLEIFYVDFQESMASRFLSSDRYLRWKIDKIFGEYDREMMKFFEKIKKTVRKDVNFHKMPGIFDFKLITPNVPLVSTKSPLASVYVYSGANLLFHSTGDRDYAFYLKYPSNFEKEIEYEVNRNIDEKSRRTGFHPVAVSGTPEESNIAHMFRSAGLRCLVKTLSRKA